jgi:mannose-6-phosphate isomerase-like protein (cupin superfamily)
MRLIGGAGVYTTPAQGELNAYISHMAVPDMSVGTYSIPAGGVDDQSPHTEDEIYVVTSGRARIETDDGSADLGPGDVVFVPAGEGHKFVDIAEDLALLVLFAPAYKSRA